MAKDNCLNKSHSNKDIDWVHKYTSKIVFGDTFLGARLIKVKDSYSGKIRSNKETARADKYTSKTVWEEWFPEFLGIKAKGNYSSKSHSNRDIDWFRRNNHRNYGLCKPHQSMDQGKSLSKKC